MSKENYISLILNDLKLHYNFKSDTEFAQFLGIAPQTLSSWYSRSSINYDLVYAKCVGISGDWLFTHQGQMFKSEFSDKNIIVSDEKTVEIPIMDISIAAGITGYMNGNAFDTLDHIIFPSNMLRKSFHVCVKTKGESMSPTILDSDNVVIRLLDKSEWYDMPDEHVYVIVDIEGKGYIKRIKNRIEKGFIVCMSDNIDKFNYPNFNLATDELISIWHAEWHISAKMPNINENYYSRVKQLEDQIDDIKNTLSSLNK